MAEEVRHYQINGKYSVVIERSAVKGVDGYKVEANSDSLDEVINHARYLKEAAEQIAAPATITVATEK